MRRISGYLLAILLALGLTACGQSAEAQWQEQYDLGVRYLSEGNYEEAVIAFTAAIEIDPKRPEAYVGRGDAYIGSGETAENLAAALADYEAAIALDETMSKAWLGLADVYVRQGEYRKALEILREALEKTENDQSIADKMIEMEADDFTDSSGNVRRTSSYDESGNLIWYHIYSYNNQGQNISITSYDASNIETGRVILDEYNPETHASTWYYTDSNIPGRVLPQKLFYDDNNNLIRREWYDEIKVLWRYSDNTYNHADQITSEKIYQLESGQWMLWLHREYIYEGNNLIRCNHYESNHDLTNYWLYEYDENGNNTVMKYYASDGTLLQKEEYRYDQQGNQIGREIYDDTGNLVQSTVNEE